MPPTSSTKKTKAELLAEEVKKAVGAGRAVAVETVDFSDPDRPRTCLEVDFPILPVNQIAAIEGNAGKPIYQVSKWWARRRSSVFRSLLLAASMKAPDDPLEAGKSVWDVYYANHQKKGALSHIKVVDPFMGGGTTIVEGSRLGMQMEGVDLNPVAWFVVKTELAQVAKDEVQALLADIEADVKPQIMPFYACDCPRGHTGKWTQVSTGKVMDANFDPLALTPAERKDYRYEGPETTYVFWVKHGPCQVTGCGHRTPVMSKPVMAIKSLSIRYWPRTCASASCRREFDLDAQDPRMAPSVPLVAAETERAYTTPSRDHLAPAKKRRVDFTCPHCDHEHREVLLPERAPKKKKVTLSLLAHPQWLRGEASAAPDGRPYGGSVTDSATATARWNDVRAEKLVLIEVRGKLPDEIRDPLTGQMVSTDAGTVPKRSSFACGSCGTVHDVLKTMTSYGRSGPMAPTLLQGHCPACAVSGDPYRGRFFAPVSDASPFNAAELEWAGDTSDHLHTYVPEQELPHGLKTTYQRIPEHGYPRFRDMFNSRQLLVLTRLAAALDSATARYSTEVVDAVVSAFQQYVRNQNMFCFWNIQADKLEPHLSNNNYYPKNLAIENSVFADYGRGNWESCARSLVNAVEWMAEPWELVSNDALARLDPALEPLVSGKSEKAFPGDPVAPAAALHCRSATDLAPISSESVDLVITDPPFGNNIQYSELADFFYVWLRKLLRKRYGQFEAELTPKAVEAVVNHARNPDDSADHYQLVLTEVWKECHRILKAGGILAFTFHHSQDEPWIAVLESLFKAGFYLEATFPVRSDEIKGEGAKPGGFGSQIIEFDVVHVCRKRTREGGRVSWAKMRREILSEVERIQRLLEHHQREGLPAADIEVIKRGKALEYYSRHYGQVFHAEGEALTVKDAVLGVLQVLDEDGRAGVEPPPVTATPITRQLMRMYADSGVLERNQVQKWLRGTGTSPSEFEERGWIRKIKKEYHLVPFLELARSWHKRHKAGIVYDYDQTAVLIGACVPGSGIRAEDTLQNPKFKPHPALGSLLEWYATRVKDPTVRTAAGRAVRIYKSWLARNQSQAEQLSMFDGGGGAR